MDLNREGIRNSSIRIDENLRGNSGTDERLKIGCTILSESRMRAKQSGVARRLVLSYEDTYPIRSNTRKNIERIRDKRWEEKRSIDVEWGSSRIQFAIRIRWIKDVVEGNKNGFSFSISLSSNFILCTHSTRLLYTWNSWVLSIHLLFAVFQLSH